MKWGHIWVSEGVDYLWGVAYVLDLIPWDQKRGRSRFPYFPLVPLPSLSLCHPPPTLHPKLDNITNGYTMAYV